MFLYQQRSAEQRFEAHAFGRLGIRAEKSDDTKHSACSTTGCVRHTQHTAVCISIGRNKVLCIYVPARISIYSCTSTYQYVCTYSTITHQYVHAKATHQYARKPHRYRDALPTHQHAMGQMPAHDLSQKPRVLGQQPHNGFQHRGPHHVQRGRLVCQPLNTIPSI